MGKASRRKREARETRHTQDPTHALVDDFVKRLGALQPCKPGDTDRFWATLDNRYGARARRLYDAIGGVIAVSDVAVFDAKNADLGLSLDVSMGYSGQLYRRQMEETALRLQGLQPSSILDVGCENGLLACFYATLWPEARVVGWDVVPSALDRATELAERLGVGDRTQFDRVDLRTVEDGEPQFDLVFASRTLFAEAVMRAGTDYGLSVSAATGVEREDLESAVGGLVRKTQPDGRLVLLERLTKPAEISALASALETAGAAVDWPGSFMITADEISGASQVFPVLVAGPSVSRGSATTDDAAIGFRAAPELAGTAPFQATAAEAVARSLRKDRLIFSARATVLDEYGEPCVMAYEVWACGPVALNYQSDSTGRRVAQVFPFFAAEEVASTLREQLEAETGEHDVEFGTPPVLGGGAPLTA